MKPQITKLVRTCAACPAQWTATTETGEQVYIRYRFGYLSARLGEQELYFEKIGSKVDGTLRTKAMIGRLGDVLDFSRLLSRATQR